VSTPPDESNRGLEARAAQAVAAILPHLGETDPRALRRRAAGRRPSGSPETYAGALRGVARTAVRAKEQLRRPGTERVSPEDLAEIVRSPDVSEPDGGA
jgi:hypothetical protein